MYVVGGHHLGDIHCPAIVGDPRVYLDTQKEGGTAMKSILLCLVSLVILAGCVTQPTAPDFSYKAGFKDGYAWAKVYYNATPTATQTPGYDEGFHDGAHEARLELGLVPEGGPLLKSINWPPATPTPTPTIAYAGPGAGWMAAQPVATLTNTPDTTPEPTPLREDWQKKAVLP
jgi:hypothetical protein